MIRIWRAAAPLELSDIRLSRNTLYPYQDEQIASHGTRPWLAIILKAIILKAIILKAITLKRVIIKNCNH